MDVNTLGVGLADALAWPVFTALIAGFVVWILRKPIIELLSRVSRVSYGSAIVDLAPLEQLIDEQVETAAPDLRVSDAIRNDPRAAVIEAWLRFELAARNILESRDIHRPVRSPLQVLEVLDRNELLPGNMYEMLDGLRRVRNSAAHDLNFSFDSSYASEYVRLLEYATGYIEAHSGGFRHSSS